MARIFTCALATILALTICGCGRRQELVIANVTRIETVILRKPAWQGSVHAISILGIGSIAGAAEVQLMLDSKIYRQVKVSGDFRFEIGGDWYSDTAEVRYVPTGVSSGNVTLRYHF